jgi:hypothetical protein
MPIKVVTELRRYRTCLSPARPRSHTLGTREARVSKRSRAEGEKRTEGGQNPTRAMQRRKEPDGGECCTGLEVSGSAVSVPRGRSPNRSSESRHSFQPPSRPGSRREVHERPNEATFDASPQMASVSSDRRAQQQRRGKWELIAKGSALTGSKRDEVCPLSNGTGHWRLPGGCSIVTGSRCVIHQLVRRDRRANPWSF